MTWANFDGKPYTRAAFLAHLAAIPTANLAWCKFITLHNTAGPTIAQWLGKVSPAQRILNLESYYEHSLGWHAGPHGFVPPSADICIYGFTDFTVRGVHASCFNNVSIGIEMVGDFNSEEFSVGPGALVRDNAVFVLAALHRRIGLQPEPHSYGEHGLHFHVECHRDNHDCPGHKVSKPDIIARVKAKMAELAGQAPPPLHVVPPTPPPAVAPAHVQTGILSTEFAGPFDAIGDRTNGYTGDLIDWREPLVALPFHFPNWRAVKVKITSKTTGKSVVAKLGDIGPWTSRIGQDQYWRTGTRPRAESNRATNGAGMDATPGVFDALGIPGKPGTRSARVDWQFIEGTPQ